MSPQARRTRVRWERNAEDMLGTRGILICLRKLGASDWSDLAATRSAAHVNGQALGSYSGSNSCRNKYYQASIEGLIDS